MGRPTTVAGLPMHAVGRPAMVVGLPTTLVSLPTACVGLPATSVSLLTTVVGQPAIRVRRPAIPEGLFSAFDFKMSVIFCKNYKVAFRQSRTFP